MVQPRILIDENIPALDQALAHCARVQQFRGRSLAPGDLKACDALIVRSVTRVDAGLLETAPLQFVGTATAGTDHVDTNYLCDRGIGFAAAPGANANAVAEWAVYAILHWAVKRSIGLEAATLGIIGFGNIGRLLYGYARGLGMQVLVNDPPLRAAGFAFPADVRHAELKEMFQEADIVSNHVPLVQEGAYPTYGLIAAEQLGFLRTGALLIHASRGGVVGESALLAAIAMRGIAAAVDVWAREPDINVMLARLAYPATPHIAGYTVQARLNGACMMARALEARFGLQPEYTVFQSAAGADGDVTVDFTDAAAVLARLEQARMLGADTRQLHDGLFASDTRRAAFFDRLRKEYPQRNETLRPL